MLKIKYILKPSIDIYPPCISQIRIIKDLGYDIEVWYGYSGDATLRLLANAGIGLRKFEFAPDSTSSKLKKLKNWVQYRHVILRAMREANDPNTVFWFGTAESAIPLYPLNRNFKMIMSVLELMDTREMSRRLSAGIARKCLAVTACEDNRALLMKFWWKLDAFPYVIPNKPYAIQIEKNSVPSCPETIDALTRINGKPFVIYQGIFQNEEYIVAVAEALKEMNRDMLFVMMGSDRKGIVPRIKQTYGNTVFLPHIQAPKHLEVTSHAYIGVVCYDHTSLNKLYCAPNKIFEYSKFGIPMLGNDIPGLVNTIGSAKAGICVPFEKEKIIEALETLLNNYEEYSKNAENFYNNLDNQKTIQRLLNQIGNVA